MNPHLLKNSTGGLLRVQLGAANAMATPRREAYLKDPADMNLHRCILDGEHRAPWPVLSEADAREIGAKGTMVVPAPVLVGREAPQADPADTLFETFERVMGGGTRHD